MQSFFGLQLTSCKKEEIEQVFSNTLNECYIISKHIHTSFSDVKKMTPTERRFIIKFIIDDMKQEQEMIKASKANRKSQ